FTIIFIQNEDKVFNPVILTSKGIHSFILRSDEDFTLLLFLPQGQRNSSLTPFETSDSLLEEFADELALLDPFPLGKEDNNFDFEADLREIEYLLNQDPSTESNIETIDLILEKFTNELALDYSPLPGDDDDDDDDLFDLKSDNDEWKKILYGDCYKDIDSEEDKNKDSKMKSLVVEAHILATRSFAYPAGIAEDVFVQVGKFTFPADFVVVDYDVNPRVPLILGRPFLRTARALVDVYEEEIILRDDDKKLIFHADSTLKHPHKHGNESINMINFIDITCEDRFLEVLKFNKSSHPSSGSTTQSYRV
nr:reverse transcriptase domain-containing protein [Tanacetum cinerariifolium]